MFKKYEKYITMMRTRLEPFLKSKHTRIGLPFLVFMVGGSLGLKQFTQLRYTFRKDNSYVDLRAESNKVGIKTKPVEETSIEKEYEKYKTLDIDNFEPIRIPRPWDEDENAAVN